MHTSRDNCENTQNIDSFFVENHHLHIMCNSYPCYPSTLMSIYITPLHFVKGIFGPLFCILKSYWIEISPVNLQSHVTCYAHRIVRILYFHQAFTFWTLLFLLCPPYWFLSPFVGSIDCILWCLRSFICTLMNLCPHLNGSLNTNLRVRRWPSLSRTHLVIHFVHY